MLVAVKQLVEDLVDTVLVTKTVRGPGYELTFNRALTRNWQLHSSSLGQPTAAEALSFFQRWGRAAEVCSLRLVSS